MSEDNKVFTYPEFTGRRRIYTDVEKITKENIFQVLEEAMLVHMENANNMVAVRKRYSATCEKENDPQGR